MDRETVVSSFFDSREKRDRDQNVVQTWRDRRNHDNILEPKAEFVVNGEKLVQQRLYEAEADVKKKTKKYSDIALREINQEFGSQWLQLQQTNQLGWSGSICVEIWKQGKDSSKNIKQKDCQETEELRRTCWGDADPQTSKNFLSCPRLRVNCWSEGRNFPRNSEQLWSDPRSRSTLYCSQSQKQCFAAILDCRTYLNDYLFKKDKTLVSSTFQEFSIIFFFKKKQGPDTEGSNKKVGEWNATRLLFSASEWSGRLNHIGGFFLSVMWLIFREFRFRNCMHLWKFLDSMEFQFWKVSFETEVCSKSADPHFTMLWSKKLGQRDQYAWCDDCICIEKTSRQACSFPKQSKSGRATCSLVTTDAYEKDKIVEMIYEHVRATGACEEAPIEARIMAALTLKKNQRSENS